MKAQVSTQKYIGKNLLSNSINFKKEISSAVLSSVFYPKTQVYLNSLFMAWIIWPYDIISSLSSPSLTMYFLSPSAFSMVALTG